MDSDAIHAISALLESRLKPVAEQLRDNKNELRKLSDSMNENRTELKTIIQRMENLENQRERQDRINRRMGRELGQNSREIKEITDALRPLLDDYKKVKPWSTVGAKVAALIIFVGSIAATALIQREVKNVRTDRPAILQPAPQAYKGTANTGRGEGGDQGGSD